MKRRYDRPAPPRVSSAQARHDVTGLGFSTEQVLARPFHTSTSHTTFQVDYLYKITALQGVGDEWGELHLSEDPSQQVFEPVRCHLQLGLRANGRRWSLRVHAVLCRAPASLNTRALQRRAHT